MNTPRIMIVEDEIIVARDLKDCLESRGYKVTSIATSGEECIKKAQEDMPDLVIMDIVLGGKIDGIDAAGQIRSSCHISTIYLTSYTDKDILERAKKTEPYGYLTKPFDEVELYTTVEMALYKQQVERKLRESEERYRSLVENIDLGITIIDNNNNILMANPQIGKFFNRPASEFVGKKCYREFEKRDTVCEHCPGKRTMATGLPQEVEAEGIRDDGTSFLVWIRTFPTFGPDGEVTGFIEVEEDITERKRVEEELTKYHQHLEEMVDKRTIELSKANKQLVQEISERKHAEETIRESEDRYRLLVENINLGIALMDTDYNVVMANAALGKILKRDVSEFVGGKCFREFEKNETVCPNCPGNQAMDTRLTQEVETEAVLKDGTRVPLWIRDFPTYGPDGAVTGFIEVVEDITERKRTEETLRNALGEVEQLKDRLQAENIYLQDEIKTEHNFEEIIGHSNVFKEILHQVEQVAPTKTSVLLLGETGTGKELLARAIHNISDRRNRPLVKINCAALPPTLIESELFGHEKGAFTGARRLKIGRFELADSGTIFLDEIGDLPLELQAKLLRVLQEGEIERLGNSGTIKIDVRIIAATNRDLRNLVESGNFRSDLYYRLNVFPIKSPPLRQRKDDIPLLVSNFVKKYSTKTGKKIKTIPLNVMESLQDYHWPGNVRELENVIERAVILTRSSNLEFAEELFEHRYYPHEQVKDLITLKDNEQFLIVKTLEECNWVIKGKHGAAARLEIPPSTLRDRIKKYGITKPQ